MRIPWSTTIQLRGVYAYFCSDFIQSMADDEGSTASEKDDDAAEGRVSMPIPILCKSFGDLSSQTSLII